MSQTKKRTIFLETDEEAKHFIPLSEESQGEESGSPSGHRKIRKINPLGFRVVVRIRKEQNMTESGLYLPEGAKQNMLDALLAKVVEVASATDTHTDEETNVSGVPLGAFVLIPKTAGVRVPWDENLRIVETKEVLAVVSEISVV